jgi:glycosyltransferase involved in cell wall biosynthesis
MKQRRILLISVAAVIGGAEVYLEALTAIIAGRARLFVVCVHPALAQQLRARGATVLQVPSLFGRRAQRIAKYPLSFFVALYAILRFRIHVVQLNGYQAAFLSVPARILGCDILLTPYHLPLSRLAKNWYLANARWAHTVVNISLMVDRQHRLLLPSVRSVVIPCWIPSIPAEPHPRTSPQTGQVLFVGRLVANKGLPDLIEAIRRLNGEVKLIVAGDGPLRRDYETLAEGLPVTFLGYHEDLADLYSQVDALIVPSHGPEGSCLVALEAMAHGLPCLMSNLAVYQEIADSGNAAMLFATGDCEALAAAIRTLTTDRNCGATLAAYAYEMIHRKYGVTAATAAYLRAFGLEPSTEDGRRKAFQ